MISVHSVTNKILSRDSNFIADEFKWPKFDNSCISMHFLNFLRSALGTSSIIGTGILVLGMALKFYTSVEKGLELKVKRFWELIPTFLEVAGGKLIKKDPKMPPIMNRVKVKSFHIRSQILSVQFKK